MEFGFNVEQALRSVSQSVQNDEIVVIHGEKFRGASPQVMDQVRQVVDAMGHASGKAQKLPSTITTFGKLQANGHIIFFKSQGTRCIGFIKVGYKKLFVRGRGGEMVEMKPLSVLDFFVDSTVQRGGYGRKLFDAMLTEMKSEPAMIAYDRPSHKLMGFLSKHFNLRSYVQQNNNYVVFDDYFTVSASNGGNKRQQAPAISSSNSTAIHTKIAPSEVRQSTTAYDNQSVFGQSHMSSFQRSTSGQGAPAAHHQNSSQFQTLSGGGWGAPKGITSNQEHQQHHMTTHYPRQSHHNQQFKIGGPGSASMEVNSSQKKIASMPITNGNPHQRTTQANTFGLNSNSIASNTSGIFEQTHSSSSGFGSTFLSSQGNLRQSQPQPPQQYNNINLKTSTQMKFGSIGQELLGGKQTRQEQEAQATLNDFKQSFSKLNFQQRGQQGVHDQTQASSTNGASQMFQTSYQSQFQEGSGGNQRLQVQHLYGQQASGHPQTNGSTVGYSPFQAFANRQQSLPSPSQKPVANYSNTFNSRIPQQQQIIQQAGAAAQSDFRTGNARQNIKNQHQATFQGGVGSSSYLDNHHQQIGQQQQQQQPTSYSSQNYQKTYSVPVTQRILSHRANTQQMTAAQASNSYGGGTRGDHNAQKSQHNQTSFSYSAGNTLSPVGGGSRAAQFLHHQQHQFQPTTTSNNNNNNNYNANSQSSAHLLQKHQGSGGVSLWQSHDQATGGVYRDGGIGLQNRSLRF